MNESQQQIALEAAGELLSKLEESGYLDFDGGEQDERTQWLGRFSDSFLSAIERATPRLTIAEQIRRKEQDAQPQRSEQQEWTPEQIAEKLMLYSKPELLAEVERLNAALTAERQRADGWKKVADAQTERADKNADAIEFATLKWSECREQLLAALAAIEKHNKQVEDDDDKGNFRYATKITVDLSLLHEHDK